jgi:hypothetical protein
MQRRLVYLSSESFRIWFQVHFSWLHLYNFQSLTCSQRRPFIEQTLSLLLQSYTDYLYLEHRDGEKEKNLKEHEHGSSKCCDKSQRTLGTNNILALECRCCTLASLVGSASGRCVDTSGAASKT